MPAITRRSLLKCGAALAAIRPAALLAAEAAPSPIGLEAIGKVAPRESRAIAASPLSVGFETLDRKHFDPARAYPLLAKLGAKWARCQTGWCRCETEKGKHDFAWLDNIVDSLLKIGIQPWFNLGYGNRLYTPEADEPAVGWAPVFDDAARQAWLRFVEAIADHFRGRVRHWELWNEPNIAQFWKPAKPSPADYVALVKLTAPAIRKAIPDAVLVGGAYAGIPMAYIKGCNVFGASSIVLLMMLYRAMNPNLALGLGTGGAFLCAQASIALLFRVPLTPLQYGAMLAIAAGMAAFSIGGRTS